MGADSVSLARRRALGSMGDRARRGLGLSTASECDEAGDPRYGRLEPLLVPRDNRWQCIGLLRQSGAALAISTDADYVPMGVCDGY